jgi:hypothetical protein
MRDFCSDFLPAVFDILEWSRQKPQVKKMYKKAHLATTGSFERSLVSASVNFGSDFADRFEFPIRLAASVNDEWKRNDEGDSHDQQ